MNPERRKILSRVDERLAAIRRDWRWMTVQLNESAQSINNWRKHRGIPTAKYAAVAHLLGWSVDQLLGKENGSDATDWPFPNIPAQRLKALTPGQRLQAEGVLMDALAELEEARREKNQPPIPPDRPIPRPARNRRTA